MTGEMRDYQMFPVPFTTGPIANPITAAGNTGNLNIESWASLVATINISAFSGFTSITFSVDEYDPTTNTYVSLGATSALTGTGTTRLVINPLLSQFIRLSWTVVGSGSVTATVGAKFRAA